MAYCTLFDKYYADKGIVMIDSLLSQGRDAMVYVLCMDEKVHTVVSSYYKTGVYAIDLSILKEYETRLVNIERGRSKGELCWTCTAILIKYVLERMQEDICTYIDADVFFYSNPTVLYEEMLKANCTVQVIPHNFSLNHYGKYQARMNGQNCVQFNTFMNEKRAYHY